MLRLQRSNLTIIGRRALQAAAGATNQLPAHRQLSNLRRKRIKENYQKYNDNIQKYNSPPLGMTDPFEYSGENVGEYSKKASLSPWTPLPDSVARRIFDIAQVQEDDVSCIVKKSSILNLVPSHPFEFLHLFHSPSIAA